MKTLRENFLTVLAKIQEKVEVSHVIVVLASLLMKISSLTWN